MNLVVCACHSNSTNKCPKLSCKNSLLIAFPPARLGTMKLCFWSKHFFCFLRTPSAARGRGLGIDPHRLLFFYSQGCTGERELGIDPDQLLQTLIVLEGICHLNLWHLIVNACFLLCSQDHEWIGIKSLCSCSLIDDRILHHNYIRPLFVKHRCTLCFFGFTNILVFLLDFFFFFHCNFWIFLCNWRLAPWHQTTHEGMDSTIVVFGTRYGSRDESPLKKAFLHKIRLDGKFQNIKRNHISFFCCIACTHLHRKQQRHPFASIVPK